MLIFWMTMSIWHGITRIWQGEEGEIRLAFMDPPGFAAQHQHQHQPQPRLDAQGGRNGVV